MRVEKCLESLRILYKHKLLTIKNIKQILAINLPQLREVNFYVDKSTRTN